MSAIISLAKRAALEPAVTGTLLYLLTRGPEVWSTTLQNILSHPIPLVNHVQTYITPTTVVKALKWLVTIGVVRKINSALNTYALNHWQFSKQGAPWDFDAGRKTEIAVVTGGCSGIGLLTVKELSKRMRVVVLDIQDSHPDLKALPSVTVYKCNITSAKELSEVANRVRSEVGTPTILINNAGIGSHNLILETSEESLERIFRVNLLSHWTTIKEFLPAMLENKKGHVVEIASLASYVGVAGIADYASTKAGVLALYETLNQELKHRYENGRCIQTTCVHPTWIATPLIAGHTKAIEAGGMPILPPSMVANAILKQVLGGKSGHVFVPDEMYVTSLVRSWPTWIQERIRDRGGKIDPNAV